MSSASETLLRIQGEKSPLLGLLEGFAGGVSSAQDNQYSRAKAILELQQQREQKKRMEEQDRMLRQQIEQQTKQAFNATNPNAPVMPVQKLEMGIKTNDQGYLTPTWKTVETKQPTYQRSEYADASGRARVGSFDPATGKTIQAESDPFAPVAKNSESDPIKKAKDLRNEFTDLSKDFFKVNESVARLRASAQDPSAAGDLSLIFNYMKILDPGSTVREGEFATAQNAAGIPERIVAQYNKALSGERLAPDTRADFVDRGEKLFEEQKAVHGRRVSEYQRLAESVGADPRQVIVNQTIDSAGGIDPKVTGKPQKIGRFTVTVEN